MKPPPISDPRYLQVAILLGYAIVAREVFHFERTHATLLLCCLVAVGLDLLYGRFVYHRFQFPLSALIIGIASSLLLDARSPLVYAAAVACAVTSKAVVTYRGRHFFNPANFGVVLVLQLLPGHVTGMPALFNGYLTPSLVFGALGLLTIFWAQQMEVSLSWILGFLALAVVRAEFFGGSPWFKMAPGLGPAFLLFSFHMISDPATTPRTRPLRIGFGLAVALVDAIYRQLEIPYGSFYALFVVSAVTPWIRDREAASGQSAVAG